MRETSHSPSGVPASGPGLRPRSIPPMASPNSTPGVPPPPPPPPGPAPPPPPPSKAFKIKRPDQNAKSNAAVPTTPKSESEGDWLKELKGKFADGNKLKRPSLAELSRPASAGLFEEDKPEWMGRKLKKTNVGEKGRSQSTTGFEDRLKENEPVSHLPAKKPVVPDPKYTEMPPPPKPSQSVNRNVPKFVAEKAAQLSSPAPNSAGDESTRKPIEKSVFEESPLEQDSKGAIPGDNDKFIFLDNTRAGNEEDNWWLVWMCRMIGVMMIVYSMGEFESLIRFSAVANGAGRIGDL